MHAAGSVFGSGGALPRGVRQLLLINGGIFLAQLVVPPLTQMFGLIPPRVLGLELWRPFTYMFLHGGLFHLFVNMFMLYMFGAPLERIWGRRRFVRYYLLCGVGAGLVAMLPLDAFFYANTIGASGAVYGVMLAFGLLFPSARILVLFLVPMSARHFVIVLGFIAFASSISATNDGVSHIAHLGGLVVGYILLRRDGLLPRRYGPPPPWTRLWNDLKRRRRRARFDAYDRRRDTLH